MSQQSKKATHRKPLIWWIDDDFDHESSDRRTLLEILNSTGRVQIVDIHPVDLGEKLSSNITPIPDLFLVDFKLITGQHPDKHIKFPFMALPAGGMIRDKFPERPIYLVSAVIGEEQAEKDADFFDRVLTLQKLTAEGADILSHDAEDYTAIRRVKNRLDIKPILRLLAVPSASTDSIKRVLPEPMRKGMGQAIQKGMNDIKLTYSKASGLYFAQWVRRELLRLPGPLYDDLYSATLLGMKVKYFKEKFTLKTNVEGCLYRGVFHRTTSRRWWQAALLEFISNIAAKEGKTVTDSWKLAPEIFKVPEEELSKCVVCDLPWPETVGEDLHNRDRREPAHWRCSLDDPRRQPQVHFETTRILLD